ncbi:carbohydrate-binding protein [Rathayibacter sp. VKM Ac-2760]|uniref:carbohydrate-binding protein n=1 Tax=Rathayibacter sp. VKM Ac-2760 TaxID=2609253 RepID=UPI0013179485|nr:carbohydrate-binding protein [Rathayibacter sp. VKM Ac-2760]QHC59503.1 carbohydrate-binding protein [Rathayibacter sp. VKM Ac-2760]
MAGWTTLGVVAGGALLGAAPAFAQEQPPAASSTQSSGALGVPEWSATATYLGGQQVTRDGKLYTAGWWTNGDDPRLVSGAIGSGKVWAPAKAVLRPAAAPAPVAAPTPVAVPAPSAAPAAAAAPSAPIAGIDGVSGWSAAATYTGGQQVARDGKLYTAGWWTSGQDPRQDSGPIGSGKVWQPATAVTTPKPPAAPAPTATPAPSKAPAAPAPTTAPATPSVPAPAKTIAPPPPAAPSGTPVTGTAPAVLASGYKDVTINMDWNTNQLRTVHNGRIIPLVGADSWASRTGSRAVTLGFATGAGDDPNWAGISATAFKRSIDQLTAANVDYVLSTGGNAGVFTANAEQLDSFISRYASKNLIGVDFDIERQQTPEQIQELVHAAAVAEVKYPRLRFSFTLATLAASDGSKGSLNGLGVTTVDAIKASGLKNYTVNLMTMDYGGKNTGAAVMRTDTAGNILSTDMGASAIQAARNVNEKFGIPFSKLELTPMIGVNDVTEEVTTPEDLAAIAAFVKAEGLAGLHHWSIDRDTPSTLGSVSPSGSGTSNASAAYTAILNRVG